MRDKNTPKKREQSDYDAHSFQSELEKRERNKNNNYQKVFVPPNLKNMLNTQSNKKSLKRFKIIKLLMNLKVKVQEWFYTVRTSSNLDLTYLNWT